MTRVKISKYSDNSVSNITPTDLVSKIKKHSRSNY